MPRDDSHEHSTIHPEHHCTFLLRGFHSCRVRGVVQLISVADTPQSFSLQFKPCFGGNLYQAIGRKEFCQESHLCTKVSDGLIAGSSSCSAPWEGAVVLAECQAGQQQHSG